MALTAHGEVPFDVSHGFQLKDSRYASFTSSLAPLLAKHDTALENEIVDQYLEDSAVTEEVSESSTVTPATLSSWDPICGVSNRPGLVDCDSMKKDLVSVTSSSNTADRQVIEADCDTKMDPPVEAYSNLHNDWNSTITSTTYSTESSRSPWNNNSHSSVCPDDSLEPLLRRAFCARIAESIEESKNRLIGNQRMTSHRGLEESAMSISSIGRTEAGPLPSSTLFGRAFRNSPHATSRTNTQTTISRPLQSAEQRSALGKSTEDMIKLIYGHRSSTRLGSSLSFHNPTEHDHEQSRRGKDQDQVDLLIGRHKSVQWRDQEFGNAREDDMSDILDAYFEHDPEAIAPEETNKVRRQHKIRAQNLSARDCEKAAARSIFRATPDWQDLDKISRFLKATKDLSQSKPMSMT